MLSTRFWEFPRLVRSALRVPDGADGSSIFWPLIIRAFKQRSSLGSSFIVCGKFKARVVLSMFNFMTCFVWKRNALIRN